MPYHPWNRKLSAVNSRRLYVSAMVVPKEKFVEWMERYTKGSGNL